MALRRNIKREGRSLASRLISAGLLFLTLCALAVAGFIIWFNDDHVRDPLLKLINDRSGVSFSVGSVEFSPLYPDTLKLHDVGINGGTIGELYLEYDLKSVLAGDRLVIRDLDDRGVNLSPADLEKLSSDKLGFESVNFSRVKLADINLQLPYLSAAKATLRLNEVNLDPKSGLTFENGTLATQEGVLDGTPIKHISLEFSRQNNSLAFKDLSLETLGGTISGSGEIKPAQASDNGASASAQGTSADPASLLPPADRIISFDIMQLDGLILQDPYVLSSRYNLNAGKAELQNLVAVFKRDDLLISGISGIVSDFSLKNGKLKGQFKGSIDEISKPLKQLTFGKNQGWVTVNAEEANLSLEGDLFEGRYSVQAQYGFSGRKTVIQNLRLSECKFEPDDSLSAYAANFFKGRDLIINNGAFNKIEVLSHISTLPLSVKQLSGSFSGLSFDESGLPKGHPAGLINLTADGIFYSDLGISRLNLISNLTPDLITVNCPEMKFQNSGLNFALSLSQNAGKSYLIAQTHDFNLTELNSNLLPHLFDGRVSMEAALKSFGEWPVLLNNLSGNVHIEGDNLLISNFGLDLINGGPKQDYELDLNGLAGALADADCGLHGPELNFTAADGQAELKGHSRLTTSEATLNARLSLLSLELSGKAYFISLPKDNITVIDFSGTISDPRFKLSALSRGEARPGLFATTGQEDSSMRALEEEHRREAEKKAFEAKLESIPEELRAAMEALQGQEPVNHNKDSVPTAIPEQPEPVATDAPALKEKTAKSDNSEDSTAGNHAQDTEPAAEKIVCEEAPAENEDLSENKAKRSSENSTTEKKPNESNQIFENEPDADSVKNVNLAPDAEGKPKNEEKTHSVIDDKVN